MPANLKSSGQDDFVKVAGHELQTPITSAKAFLDIHKKRLQKNKDKGSLYLVNKVDEQLGRIERLVNDLLEVSRIEQGTISYKMEMVSIDEIIKKIVVDYQMSSSDHKFKKKGEINTKILCDVDRVSQIISNLVNNAVKYSKKGSEIIIGVEKTKGEVIVFIKDSGIGIPVKEQANVFNRFYRVKRKDNVSGFGLGLYLAKQIIEAHKGRIWLDSEVGKGTTFFFSLPLK